MAWIVDLRSGMSVELVVDRIVSGESEKHFGDYWRQGIWGERHATAFQELKRGL